jgi:glycosyltransferase involved in cell wall biosynthesis
MFTRWMAEPASAGGRHGITRFAQEVWVLRPDVQEAYPDLDDAATAEGFIGWLWAHGRPELDLPRSLLGTPPAWLEIETGEVPLVVEVVGYLRGNLGLGSAARGYVDVLEAAGATVTTKALRLDAPIARRGGALPPRLESHSHEERTLAGGAQAPVVLLCVNADQTPEAHRELGLGDAPERYVIGNWAWETDHVPDRWEPAFRLVDELWVYSNYIADTLARHSDVPVLVMPLPIRPPDPQGARVPFEVDDRFAFLFAFDHFSTAARKNPMGLVRAYLQAFPKPSPAGPQLVLKTINAQYRPQDHAELRAAIGGRDDVTLVDAMLEPGEMAALFHRADAYVSLHRAEGYGLTLADSMALGKPVIGTAATGNLDFMTSANSFLVEAEPVPVGPDAEHYAHAGATWFEPSIDHAATLMRQVFEDRDEAARRGARAKVDISTQLSVEAVAERARQRLHHLSGRLGGAGPAGATPLTRTVDKAVAKAYAPVGLAPLASRPRAALRTAVLRAIQPYTAHEQQVDRALATGLTGLAGELEALRSARERDRDRLRALERRLAELERRSP